MNANSMSSRSSLLVLLLLLAGQHHPANALETNEIRFNFSRLPKSVRPSNYMISILFHPSLQTYSGEVDIEFDIQQTEEPASSSQGQPPPSALDRKKILLNADGLVVTHVVFRQDGREEVMEAIDYDPLNKILAVTLSREPDSGRSAHLVLKFSGEVQEEPKGLFWNKLDPNNWSLATNFAPDYARRVFPCLDEPEFKATFQLTIKHPRGTVALSTMESRRVTPLGDYFETEFYHTPIMSSFLLGFFVGQFGFIENTEMPDVSFYIYAPKGAPEYASEMLILSVEIYKEVKKYFSGILQPLEQIVIVAVNSEPTAMENFGLMTMKWESLIAYQTTTRPDEYIHAVTVLTKKLIRLWLGHLVTMRWWDDLWLIEGLVSYLATELITKKYPDTLSDSYALADTTISAMHDEDLSGNARPIKDERIQTAGEIVASYDSTTNKKSEAVVRMFANFLGKKKFKLAIRDLINSRAYKVVAGEDFWKTLANYGREHRHVLKRAPQWIRQAGYPIIYVSTEDDSMKVRQESSYGSNVWSVPVTYEVQSEHEYKFDSFVLSGSQMEIPLPDWFNPSVEDNWLQLNVYYQGFYRVVYEPALLKYALNRAVIDRRMLPADRLKLLSDSYASSKRTGRMNDFNRMLKKFAESNEIDDGVVLLLTKILTELHDNEIALPSIGPMNQLMMKYYDVNRDTRPWDELAQSMHKDFTRSQVVDYLANTVKRDDVIVKLQGIARINRKLPPFLLQAIGNMGRRGVRF